MKCNSKGSDILVHRCCRFHHLSQWQFHHLAGRTCSCQAAASSWWLSSQWTFHLGVSISHYLHWTQNLKMTHTEIKPNYADTPRFKVLTAVLLKITVFWNVVLCWWVNSYWCFERIYTVPSPLGSGSQLFDPKDDGTTFLQHVGNSIPVDMA